MKLLALVGALVLAMSVHRDETQLASSADGKSQLVQVDASGPEGGGALSYRIIGDAPLEVFVSNDMSPGDGSRPQHISAKECRQNLAQLDAEAKKRHIAGVVVHPEVCERKDRSGGVIAQAPASH
jgi:hypothetical protein